MSVLELVEKTNWEVLCGENLQDASIDGCFCGDLLSWVMSHGEKGQAWVTVQAHLNVIAVAVLCEFSCIIIAHDAQVEQDAIERAKNENIIVLRSKLSCYEVSKKCVELGL